MFTKKIKYVSSHVRRDNKRTISQIDEDFIEFSDGSRITFDHEQDCCEYNYADFSQLDDLTKSYVFEGDILFDYAEGGFTFGDKRRIFFVPCYSSQNGYYSTDIDIYWNGVCVLSFECQEDFD